MRMFRGDVGRVSRKPQASSGRRTRHAGRANSLVDRAADGILVLDRERPVDSGTHALLERGGLYRTTTTSPRPRPRAKSRLQVASVWSVSPREPVPKHSPRAPADFERVMNGEEGDSFASHGPSHGQFL